jgi:hypothetical protein
MIDYNKGKERAIVDLFTRKSSDWSYEKEVRIIVMDDSPFHKFNKDFLTGIVFGCRTLPAERLKILALVKSVGYNIHALKAIKGRFELKFEPVAL